ncbi:MAG: S-layer protein domain-containing protein [Methanothrix sp.]
MGFSFADDSNGLEIRGQVATGNFEWTARNFAGFYYDIDDDLGTEKLTTLITEGNKLQEPSGITYTTTVQKNDFDFADWGFYNVIGFQANKYFAGYVNDEYVDDANEILFKESTDENSLSDEQLEEILIDFDNQMTVTSGTPLRLDEGYELLIKSIDTSTGMVYLELAKDGQVVDSKVVSPSKIYSTMADETYYYRKDVGDSKDLVIIAVHFKNAFRGADQNLATIDGIWQISDVPTMVTVDTEYDKMRIASVSADTITMDNKDRTVTLSKNKDISLMGDVKIKTSGQDVVDGANPLRYYIYKEITEPGTYEIRGQVATGDFEWSPQNFAGFYYDMNDDLGTERLTTTITEGNKLQEPYGVAYTTTVQNCNFKFNDWGSYEVIGFLGERYFAGYDSYGTDSVILEEANVTNLLDYGELAKILIDEGREDVRDFSEAIDLKENYSLKLSVGTDNKGMLVELQKGKMVIDKKAVLMPGTYVYISKVGDVPGMPIIAAHFHEPIFLEGKSYIKIDGLWQISEVATEVKVDTEYDKMRIATVTGDTITMDNKDNTVTLSKNKDIELMGDVSIKTSDQDVIDDTNPQRYYLFKSQEIVPAGGSL